MSEIPLSKETTKRLVTELPEIDFKSLEIEPIYTEKNKLPSFNSTSISVDPTECNGSVISTRIKIKNLDEGALKEYRTKQKQKQNVSIILRSIVFMRILINNFGYTFVVNRNIRKARVGLDYYPIEKIYDYEGKLIFDLNTIEKEDTQRRIQFCQFLCIDLMISHLEKYGYEFKKKQTKKATELRGKYVPITLTKIYNFSWLSQHHEQFTFNMIEMENTLGIEIYNWIKTIFDDKRVEKIVAGKINVINHIIPTLQFKKPLSESCVVNYDTYGLAIEMIYCSDYMTKVFSSANETQQQVEIHPK